MINTGNNVKETLSDLTLSQIVTDNFKTAAVFEKYSLDFCCRGNKTISDACIEKGVSSEQVFEDLNELLVTRAETNGRYNEWAPDFLADYIVNNHHSYVRGIIPILTIHTQKIASVHGKNHPETIEVARIFGIVYKDLKQHMMKEEEILFPYIRQLVKSSNSQSKTERPYFGSVQNPIKMMEAEHESAGDELFEIRRLTNNYTPPADACNTYKICYQELKEFEEDLHKHVHLENNILFPKAIQLENDVLSR
ncbi:MAG: iron-sulfur cluster repair di-iron protein [Ignavibacteriaceae bacterium]